MKYYVIFHILLLLPITSFQVYTLFTASSGTKVLGGDRNAALGGMAALVDHLDLKPSWKPVQPRY